MKNKLILKYYKYISTLINYHKINYDFSKKKPHQSFQLEKFTMLIWIIEKNLSLSKRFENLKVIL